MRLPRRAPRPRNGTALAIVADAVLLGYGLDLLAKGSTRAGLFLVLLFGFLLVGEAAMAARRRRPGLERFRLAWAYIFFIGLPVWLAAIGATTLATGGSPAWAIASFIGAGAMVFLVGRGLLRRKRHRL
jgi:hypothetical protein